MGMQKIKRWFGAGVMLLGAVFLSGCGKESTAGGWNMEDGTLYAQYRDVSVDSSSLAVRDGVAAGSLGQLVKAQCLAAQDSVYVAGHRMNQGQAETAVYRIGEDGKPVFAASYAGESLVAWCAAEDGIALLSCHTEQQGEDYYGQYTLYSLRTGEDGGLEESERWSLTEALAPLEGEWKSADGGIRNGTLSVDAMAVAGGRLVLADSRSSSIVAVDLASGETLGSVSVGETVKAVSYDGEDSISVLTAYGTMYECSLENASRTTSGEKLFRTVGGAGGCAIGKDYIYAGSRQSLYIVNIKDGQERKLLDYAQGMAAMEGSLWFDEETGQGVAASYDESFYRVYCYFLSGEPFPDEKEGREIITLENFWVDDELKRAAMEFNRSNDKYWVEVKEAEDEEDVETYWTRFNARLAAKNGPDLMAANTYQARYGDYMRQGVYEDLTPYIQRDLNPEEYVQSAFYAFEKDGSVYSLGSRFLLNVELVDRGMADSAEDLSLFDLFRLAEESEIPVFLKDFYQDRLLYKCLYMLGSGIFEEENVRKCILFAEKYGDDASGQSDEYVVGKDVLLSGETIRSPLDVPDMELYYGEEVLMIGEPTEWGNQYEFYFSPEALAISAVSEKKEGAWAFIKYLLDREYQYTIKDGFPVRKDAFDAMLEQYQQPQTYEVYIEVIDELVTITNNYRLGRCSRSGMEDGIEAVTAEQTERLRAMVEHAGMNVMEIEYGAAVIVCEEADSYYQGAKTLDQVMEAIMGRLRMYQGERQ